MFFERDSGRFIQCLALTDAYQKDDHPDMWYCNVRTIYGEREFAQSDNAPHYGPRLSENDW
jgi:hypothetical protein